MLVKTNIEGLVRDMDNKAILNTDISEYSAYKARREKEKRLDSICEEMNSLKSEISEIKELLMQFCASNIRN